MAKDRSRSGLPFALAGLVALLMLAMPSGSLATVGVGGGTAVLPHELSPWNMFLAADLVVKGVMVGLAFASLLVWTVWLAKTIELFTATTSLRRSRRRLSAEPSLARAHAAFGKSRGLPAQCLAAAESEIGLSAGIIDTSGIERRIASRIADIEAAAVRSIRAGTGLIATVGATAPFVGLFGTVWGIMNSFIGISTSQTTNLAVVAPGIAEALLATAIGLVAAIPAVILYNQLARATASYKALVRENAAEVLRLASRDLDRDSVGLATPQRRRALAAE